MPPRPHDADEPDEERPEGAGRQDDRDDDADAGAPEVPELDDADVAARWAGIVSTLSAPDPRSWAPDPAVEEAENHFVPPDPGPVLGGDPLLTMAWSAVVGVPLLFMVVVIAWRDVPALVLQLAGVAFLAGIGLLLWRMPRDRDHDAGPGAVV